MFLEGFKVVQGQGSELWFDKKYNLFLGGPYAHDISEFNKVEENMRKRRKEVQALLGKDEYVFSLTAYPRMGCENFTEPETLPDPINSVTKSLFWPDPAIFCGHPR